MIHGTKEMIQKAEFIPDQDRVKHKRGGTMNVIALNGSARGKKGVTWKLLDSLLKGLSEGGATVRDIQLKEMNI